MKVIISNVLQDKYTNFVLVSSFKRASELNGVDTVIIHKYAESDFDAGVFITNFNKNGVKMFVYISDTPSKTMMATMKGVEGSCFEDEFYLDDEEELVALLESLEDVDTAISRSEPALNVLNDFVDAASRGEERVNTPLFLSTVTNSLHEIAELTQQQSLQLTEMGKSVVNVFEKASSIIQKLSMMKKESDDKLMELETNAAALAPSRATFSNSIMFFAPYTYRSNAKLLLIREYSPVRYLTSFVLGYLHHLHYELNRRPKLIFVVGKGAGVASKYEDYPIITQDNMSLASLYTGEVVVTNNPKKEVMKELLSKPNDVFVVVDRLYSSVDIVSGRLVKVNALSSRSDIARFKVKPEDSIFTVTRQPKQLFEIPVMKNFPVEIEARYANYAQVMSSSYEILDMKLGLKASD